MRGPVASQAPKNWPARAHRLGKATDGATYFDGVVGDSGFETLADQCDRSRLKRGVRSDRHPDTACDCKQAPPSHGRSRSASPGIPPSSHRRVLLVAAVSRSELGRTRLPIGLVRTHSAVRRGGGSQHPRQGRARRRVRWQVYLPGPRLQVPLVSAGAGFRGPTLAVGAELEGLLAAAAVWCAAIHHHPGASQFQPRPVHLCRNVIRPRVRS
jgi:hypothetical protein